MKKNYSELIKKISQSVPVPSEGVATPGFNPSNKSSNNSPGSSSRRTTSLGSKAVKDMQMAIVQLAEVASSTELASMQGDTADKQYGAQTRALPGDGETKDDKEYLGGSNPFGNFLMENYVNTKSTSTQYVNVDVAGEKPRQNASNEGKSLRGLIDSLRRIGTPGVAGGEKSADGVWKSRTQTALKNIILITEGILKFSKDMGLEVAGYSEVDLKKLTNLVPANYTDMKNSQEISERATRITAHIKALTSFFTNLQSQIEKPEIKDFVQQKKSFEQYQVKPKEVEIPDVHVGKFVPVQIPGSKIRITLEDLKSLPKFQKFLTESGVKNVDENTIKKTLEEFKRQLG